MLSACTARRVWLGLLSAAITVIAGVLAVPLPLSSASAQAASAAGNGVGASHPGMILTVGGITACFASSRAARRPPARWVRGGYRLCRRRRSLVARPVKSALPIRDGPRVDGRLAADAQRAAANGFPHGISTMSRLPSRIAATGEYRSATVQQLIEAGFSVLKQATTHITIRFSCPNP